MSMSLFSRKSKASQTPTTHGKVNGHAPSRKNGGTNGVTNGVPVDPILQRMAQQAESRKRMNSQTPDYSIKSAYPSAGHNNSNPRSPPRTKDAPIEAISPAKPPTNKLRKSSSNMTPPTHPQAQFTRTFDPDMQKVRMPPTQQFSKDSGYASITRSTTMNTISQPEPSALPDSELLTRHRAINASLSRYEGEARTMTAATASAPILPQAPRVIKARTAPTTPTNPPSTPTRAVAAQAEDKPYVSRLDPGPASSGFLTSSVVPTISSPRRDVAERLESAPPQVVPASPSARKPIEDASMRGPESGGKPMPNISRPRESSRSKGAEELRAAATSQSQARAPVIQRTKDQESTSITRNSGSGYISPSATEKQAAQDRTSSSTASYQTTRETPELAAGAIPALKGLPAGDPESAPLLVSTPKDEFPYLAGISKGPTMPPVSVLDGYKVNRRGQILDEEGDVIGELVSGEIVHCVRRIVNERGEILDDWGKIIGHAAAVPRRAAEDDAPPRLNFANELVHSPVSPVVGMSIPFSESRETTTTLTKPMIHRASQRANSVPERTLNNTDSNGNVFYVELDASADSQAAPLMDQSDIFIPPYGGTQAQTELRSRSATNLAEIKRIADGRQSKQNSHAHSASQGNVSLEERLERRGSKWVTRYYDTRTGEEMPSTNMNSEARRESAATASSPNESDRSRSYSLMTNTAPKAVLGPTWESLLDTVPDRSQFPAQHKSVIIDGKLASQSSIRSPARAETMPSLVGSNAGSVKMSSGSTAGKSSRRASQQNGAAGRNSIHQPFAKSPLSSIANTPPDTAAGEGSDSSFQRQLLVPNNLGRMQNSSSQTRVAPPPAALVDDDENAAPAPIIRKKNAPSVKDRKRKSIFGFSFGKSKQPVATAN